MKNYTKNRFPSIPGSVGILLLFLMIYLFSGMGGQNKYNYEYGGSCCSTPVLLFLVINLYFTIKVLLTFSSIYFFDDVTDAVRGEPGAIRVRILVDKVLSRINPILREMTLFSFLLYIVLCFISKGQMLLPKNLIQFVSLYSAEFVFITAITIITARETLIKRGNRSFHICVILLLHFVIWLLWTVMLGPLPAILIERLGFELLRRTDKSLIIAFSIQMSALYFYVALYLYGLSLYYDIFERNEYHLKIQSEI